MDRGALRGRRQLLTAELSSAIECNFRRLIGQDMLFWFTYVEIIEAIQKLRLSCGLSQRFFRRPVGVPSGNEPTCFSR